MAETPEQQRKRLYIKRLSRYEEKLIRCLECDLAFARVGSHVVQVHGYESAKEYRKAHGLDWKSGKTTCVPSHREYMAKMSKQNGTEKNLLRGASHRFKKGGKSSEVVKDYWRQKKNQPTQQYLLTY
jgi:phosphoribosylanthranilate isomerase